MVVMVLVVLAAAMEKNVQVTNPTVNQCRCSGLPAAPYA